MNDRMTERYQLLWLHQSQNLYENQIQNQISDLVSNTEDLLTFSEDYDTEKKDSISDYTAIKHC